MDMVLVIGSHSSGNSQRLRDIAESICGKAYLIDSPTTSTGRGLRAVDKVGITAGASTPNFSVEQMLKALQARVGIDVANSDAQIFEYKSFAGYRRMFNQQRKKTRQVTVGAVKIGGDAPVSVQSMTTTDTRDIDATVKQIHRLEEAGCDIIRVAVLDKEGAESLGEIKRQIKIPLVADIHFHYRLALIAAEQGVDKIRTNPGNIGDDVKMESVVAVCKERNIPIRIGVNTGSLEKDLVNQYGSLQSRSAGRIGDAQGAPAGRNGISTISSFP